MRSPKPTFALVESLKGADMCTCYTGKQDYDLYRSIARMRLHLPDYHSDDKFLRR